MSPPRASLDRDGVLDAAVVLPAAADTALLALTAIADAVDTKPPSLYSHVCGIAGGAR